MPNHIRTIWQRFKECLSAAIDVLSEVGYYSQRRRFINKLVSLAFNDGTNGTRPRTVEEIKLLLKFNPVLGYTDSYLMQIYKAEYEEGAELAEVDLTSIETEVDVWKDDK